MIIKYKLIKLNQGIKFKNSIILHAIPINNIMYCYDKIRLILII